MTSVCPRDGQPLINPFEGEPSFTGKFEFLGVVGAGGMGVIYKAHQTALNKPVAIKMVHAHMVSQEAFQRFQLEGKAIGLLSHPYIINVHDFGVTQKGQPFMIMDFVEGKTLSEVLQRDSHLTKHRFLRIFSLICEALIHAHKRGVLHRDIKPSNVMLIRNEQGQEEIRIMDFGIAKLIGDTESGAQHLTKTGEAIGSPVYMSPEQARGAKIDHRSDLYSLGCMMYESLAGTPPFVGNTPLETMLMHLNETPLPMREASLGLEIDPVIEKIVLKLLEKEPSDRYDSMDQLLRDLQVLETMPASKQSRRAGNGAGTFASEPEPTIITRKTGTSVSLVLFGITGLLLAGVIAAWYLLSQPKQIAVTKLPNTQKNLVSTDRDTKIKQLHKKIQYQPGTIMAALSSMLASKQKVVDLEHFKGQKLTKKDLQSLDWQSAVDVHTLVMSGLDVDDEALEGIDTSNMKLYKLNLSNTKVATLDAFANMKTLEKLGLNDSQLSSAGIDNICKLPNLRDLFIKGTRITDADLAKLGTSLSLKSLNIQSCQNLSKEAIDKLINDLGSECEVYR